MSNVIIALESLLMIHIHEEHMIRSLHAVLLNIPLFILIASGLALAGAYLSEYVFGLAPCLLCYYQRYAYWAVMALCIIALIAKNHSRKTYLLFTLLAIVGLLIETGIAFFHMGVEYKWFEMLSGCKGSLDYLDTITTLDNIDYEPVIPCDQPPFVYILSMAGWNMIYAFAIFAISLRFSIRNIKNGSANIT